MSKKCDLQIELEESAATGRYRPGDEIAGTLRVQVNADCKCRTLPVTLSWRTHGIGNTDTLEVGRVEVGPFEWQAGSTHEFPFRFTMPNGPVSYRGKLINVDWYIEAEADLAWARDPKVERDVLLLPMPAEMVDGDPYRGGGRVQARKHEQGQNTHIDPLVVLFPFSIFWALMVFWWMPAWDNTFMVVMGLLVGGLPIFIFGLPLFWRRAGKSAVGAMDISFTPETATKGEDLTVSMSIKPNKRLQVNSIKGTLMGVEVAISGHGTDRVTHRHTLHEQEFVWMESAQSISPASGSEFTWATRLPADAAPSFSAEDNKVLWAIEVHVDIPRWPDHKERREFTVYPS